MPKETVLIVDDEKDILELLRYNLAKEGYKIFQASSGEEAIKLAKSASPDLVVLDLMLPGIDGLDVCKIIKNDPKTKNIAVIMLTAKNEESDIVTGLELGADDYIIKPFSPKVLIARVRSVIRRKSKLSVSDDDSIKIVDLEINPGRHEVLIKGKPVDLTYTEFKILHFLAKRPGWVFTRYQIVDAVRGGEYIVTERSVDVQIVGLRKKLGEFGNFIETIRGVGYRLKEFTSDDEKSV